MQKDIFFIEAAAILIGTTIGAGILAIPYVIAEAGFLSGLVMVIVVTLVMLVLNLMVGQLALGTKDLHQLPGYARKYLGRTGERLMFVLMVASIYGALLAFVIGEGRVLADLFGGSPMLSSLIFLAVGAIILYFGLSIIRRLELLLTLVIFFIILLLFWWSRPFIAWDNLKVFSWQNILLPYGAVFFAGMGFSSIAQMREVLIGREKLLRKAIVVGTFAPAIIYVIFSLLVVGVSGSATSEVATINLGHIIGPQMIIFGNIFAFVTMATTFLALGLALKKAFIQDLRRSANVAWLLTCSVPAVALLLGLNSFANIVSIVGAVAGGLQGVLIALTWYYMHQMERNPEYRLPHTVWLLLPVLIVLLAGLFSVWW
ncbi:MAG: aromatic amino acid transport family protein [Candidatus Komeilibacteria bacterium]